MNLRQAAQQALEAMDKATRFMSDSDYKKLNQAIDDLRAALAEPDSDYERGFVDGMNLQTKGSVDKAVNRMAQTTHWEGCEAVHPECRAKTELDRKSDAIQRLWKERDELRALNAELVKALRGTVQEMLSVVASLNAEQMPHDGDEFHERLEKARAALAKVEASNGS